MTSSPIAFLRQINRWLILALIGSLGLLITLWVNTLLLEVEHDRLNQRFQMEARARADAVIAQLHGPLEHLATLQRLFGSVEHVDWDAFRKFSNPLLSQPGVRSYMWLPRVAAADRPAFELDGKALWDADFSIKSVDENSQFVRSADRDLYFPMLYRVPTQTERVLAGNDIYAAPGLAELIDQAIASSLPTATKLGSLAVDSSRINATLLFAPVYRGGIAPVTREERRAETTGLVSVALNVDDLFDAAAGSLPEIGVHVRLLDSDKPEGNRLIATWSSRQPGVQAESDELPSAYSEDFELASHVWTVQVEAAPAWMEGNRPSGLRLIWPSGLLVTLLLLAYFHRLLGRSALADSLVVTHEDDVKQRGAVETWANKLSMAVEQNPATIFIADLEGRIEYVNDKFIETTGYSRAEAIGQHSKILRPYTSDDVVYKRLWAVIKSGQSWKGELQNKRRDGTLYWERAQISPIRDSQGKITSFISIKENITELRAAMTRLEESEGRFRGAMSAMVEGLAILSPDGVFVFGNPAAAEMLGLGEGDLCGLRPEDIRRERLREDGTPFPMDEFPPTVTLREGREVRNTIVGYRSPEGKVVWVSMNTTPLLDGREQHSGVVITLTDMTERLAAQERIEFLAHHDPLTSLPNRLLLRDRAEQAQAHATRAQSRVALMFLDLDRFKTINDSLGHPVGDALLLAVVERLKACVRDSDTISRQGGDEFIILLNDVRDSEAASRVADKIHQRMAEPIVLGNQSLISSFSIGIALYPDDGVDFDSLLQKADTAMYDAKKSGRNSHRFFTEQMNRQVVEHMTLETQLRCALERNEFVLHYQPQLDLQHGKIIGVEALIRWNNPESGLVPPCKFIPVAEESGLIVPIGAWVINEACRQAKTWQDAGLPPFTVAVNLSAVQFRQHDLINTVINALVLSDLDAQWLELELTESILIQDAEATLDLVRRLKGLGVRLSVDDFGTGYSSLAYLKRFKVGKLKIDQSFIRDLVVDLEDAAIVRAIIEMARSLGLKTIAEGVETEELATLLRLAHCDEIQGYWFARPMPAAQLEAFVRAHQRP